MSLDAGSMGRDMDEGVRDRVDRYDARHYRASMVAYTSLSDRLDEPQHALYRVRHRDSAALLDMVTMGGKDPERLQDMPAGSEIHYADRDAVQYLYCEGGIKVRG